MEEKENQGKVDICISLIVRSLFRMHKFGKPSVYKHIFEKSLYFGKTESDIIRDISERSNFNERETIRFHAAYRKWKSRHNENGLVEIRMRRLGFK
jgi:hypothetical protein